MNTSFYSKTELKKIGLKSYGENVMISKKVSIYGAENISIGNNVRIDDFCILSGNIQIGSFVHIAAYCGLYGKKGIIMKDFSILAARTLLMSASDDFSGEHMISPLVPRKFTNVTGGPVILNKHVLIGAGCIIFPNLILGEGVAVGSMSLVSKNLDPWTINLGIPVRFSKKRKRTILKLEKNLEKLLSRK